MNGDDLKHGFLLSFVAQAEEEIEFLEGQPECAVEFQLLRRLLKAIKTEDRAQLERTLAEIRQAKAETVCMILDVLLDTTEAEVLASTKEGRRFDVQPAALLSHL